MKTGERAFFVRSLAVGRCAGAGIMCGGSCTTSGGLASELVADELFIGLFRLDSVQPTAWEVGVGRIRSSGDRTVLWGVAARGRASRWAVVRRLAAVSLTSAVCALLACAVELLLATTPSALC